MCSITPPFDLSVKGWFFLSLRKKIKKIATSLILLGFMTQERSQPNY